MDKNITIYKPKLSVIAGGLFVLGILFFGLTLPLIIAGTPVELRKLLGLGAMWMIGIAVTIYPLGFKLEVGSDYVKGYLFGMTISNVRASEIQAITYGNLFFGVGGHNGLTYRVFKNGRSKVYRVGEAIYGKDVIAHARRVLESRLPQSISH